jgi:hypothetical protein
MPRPQAETDARQSPIAIAWNGDGLIGRLTIGGKLWAAVEWSEKGQQWCIEDAEGRCLSHRGSIHGAEASREAAVALTESMIRDGRMPDPETARKNREERLRAAREKRERQPAEIHKREERDEQDRRSSDALMKEWEARCAEDAAPPLYEALADAFDFGDAELWKSNSFAALRPRLTLHVRCVIAELEYRLAYEIGRSRSQPFCGIGATKERRHAAAAYRKAETSAAIGRMEAKLAKAREILGQLASSDSDEAADGDLAHRNGRRP